MFHGARTVDAHAAALAVRRALGPDQVVVGVGYSMGAIVLNNYVASYGPDCALDGAIGISGGLDMRYQEQFYRAQRLWQPMLAETLRDEFLLGKWGKRILARLSEYEMLRMMRASHVTVRNKKASRIFGNVHFVSLHII
jgi:predicted alpha/beta-fold hydrolase